MRKSVFVTFLVESVDYIWNKKKKQPNQLIEGWFYNFKFFIEKQDGAIHDSLYAYDLLSAEAMSFKTYGGKIEFFNKVSIYEPLENKHTGSLLRCSVLCGIGCNCFNFNLKTDTGLLYNSCNPLHLTVSEIGWRFFTDPSLDPIGWIHVVRLFIDNCKEK